MNEKTFTNKIPNLTVYLDDKDIVLISKEELECLSNAAINGGRKKTRAIVNHYVPLDFEHGDLNKVLNPVRKNYNLSNAMIGLFTAVKMSDVVIVNAIYDNINYMILITAGISNAIAPNIDKPIDKNQYSTTLYKPGTINTVIIFDCKLSEHAIVNLFITITEAKTLLLNDYNVRLKDGRLATGTSTDTIVIGFTGEGQSIEWSGYATDFGQSVGKNFYKTLEKALKKGSWI